MFEFSHANQLDKYLIDNWSNYFSSKIIGQQIYIGIKRKRDIEIFSEIKSKNKNYGTKIDLIATDEKYFYLIETKSGDIKKNEIKLMQLCIRNFNTYKKTIGLFISPDIKDKTRKKLEQIGIKYEILNDVRVNRNIPKDNLSFEIVPIDIELKLAFMFKNYKYINYKFLEKFYFRDKCTIIMKFKFKNSLGINLNCFIGYYDETLNYEIVVYHDEFDWDGVREYTLIRPKQLNLIFRYIRRKGYVSDKFFKELRKELLLYDKQIESNITKW